MSTYDQMIVDNRYPGDFDIEKYSYSKQTRLQQDSPSQNEDKTGLFGRRVYLESPSFGNKEEEDMYRYVSSRLTDRTASMIDPVAPVHTASRADPTAPARTGAVLMDSLDFELDILGTTNTRPQIPYVKDTNPAKSQGVQSNHLANIPRADPRQDPLLGPLLAELDAMTNQQQRQQPPPIAPPSASASIYQRDTVPYQSNIVRPTNSSQPTHVLTNIANRTVTDALLEAELYDSLETKDQQQRQSNPYSASNLNLPNYLQPQPQQQQPSHLPNMDSSDIFMPPYYANEPSSFLSNFDSDDNLFRRPSLNALGQNYITNSRPLPPTQSDTIFNQTYPHMSPTQRMSYGRPPLPPNNINGQPSLVPSASSNQQNTNLFNEYQKVPSQNQFEEQTARHINPPNNQEVFFTDNKDDQYEQPQSAVVSHRTSDQPDQDSKRQAIWDELQRASAHKQDKNSKKRESPNRGKGTFGSSTMWNSTGNQQASNQFKPPQRPFYHPPPIKKTNFIEENVDMIKNKENLFHRSPARKYETMFTDRKDLQNVNVHENEEQESKLPSPLSTKPVRQSSLPVTINVNGGENSQSGPLPATVTIPLDSHISRDGDKISLNIDLRLVDFQNFKQQQQQQQQQQYQQPLEQPQWYTSDPLDRHIRKLERNIDHALPPTSPPQRSPTIPSTAANLPLNRYGRTAPGTNRSGYNPPVYGGDYSYSDKSREEDSYLSKLNYSRKNLQFKPYTGRDYEQFKKNYGFGTGHLGYDFDNTNHREKTEKLNKTKEYAQQVEARNKKKLSEVSRRTLSDTRLRTEPFKPSRFSGHVQTSIRPQQFSGKSTYSSPPVMDDMLPYIPAHRPTEVLTRPPPIPRQFMRISQNQNNEIVEQSSLQQDDDNSLKKMTVYSSQQPREPMSQNDNRRTNSIEGLVRDRTNQRRSSPPKQLPPIRSINGDNKRRPIKFDRPLLPDEPSHLSSENIRPIQIQQPTEQHANIDGKFLVAVTHPKSNEGSLSNKETLPAIEQNSNV